MALIRYWRVNCSFNINQESQGKMFLIFYNNNDDDDYNDNNDDDGWILLLLKLKQRIYFHIFDSPINFSAQPNLLTWA